MAGRCTRKEEKHAEHVCYSTAFLELVLLFLFLAPPLVELKVGQCPSSCTCSSTGYIQCKNQLLTEVPTNISLEATKFDLGWNSIRLIRTGSFPSLPLLKTLKIDYNAISNIESQAFKHMLSLSYLSLNNNLLVELTFLSSLPGRLSVLQMNSNFIQTLALVDFQRESLLELGISLNFVRNFANISIVTRELYAISCGLRVFDVDQSIGATAVKSIYMANNLIRSLPDLSSLILLEYLDLNDNLIQQTDPYLPQRLTYLTLANNRLSSIPMSWLTGDLTVLILRGNPLKSFHYDAPGDSFMDVLSLRECELDDVPILPVMTDLTHFSLLNNKLQGSFGLNTSTLPNIKVLNLAYNNLKNITVLPTGDPVFPSQDNELVHSIFELKLDGNKVNDVRFLDFFPNLVYLGLSKNDLVTFNRQNVSHFTNLKTIALQKNRISLFQGFENLPSLRVLYLSDNHIKYISPTALRGTESLSVLHLDGNYLVELPSIPDLSLSILFLGGNAIKEILPSDQDCKVQVLDLSGNGLTSLRFNSSLVINKLILNNNNLSTLEGIGAHFLQMMEVLDISDNQIFFVNTHIFEVSKISEMKCDGNFLSVVPHSPQLRILSAKRNRIQALTNTSFLISTSYTGINTSADDCMLTDLMLDWNLISYIQSSTFDACSKITVLSLSYNPLTEMEVRTFQNLPILVSFSLSHTILGNTFFGQIVPSNQGKFYNLDMDNVTVSLIEYMLPLPVQCKKISLRYNSLKIVPLLMESQNVKVVNLSFNDISLLQEEAFNFSKRLQVVDLKNNAITGILSHAFRSNLQLRIVDLQNNRIRFISQYVFGKLGHFTLLLGNNHLVNIVPSSLLPPFYSITFDPNPWSCDCALWPLREWLLHSTDGDQVLFCWTPMILRGKTLASLSHDELCPPIRVTSNPNQDLDKGANMSVDDLNTTSKGAEKQVLNGQLRFLAGAFLIGELCRLLILNL